MQLQELRSRLLRGMVIPAHPLALTPRRTLDERRQRALTRYYLAAGAGAIAVGVHTTQFAIHEGNVGLYQPVLEIASHTVRTETAESQPPALCIAGVVGRTKQAVGEATLAQDLGYDCVLLSLGALREATDDQLVDHARAVAEVLPVFGFYLQPAVGGRLLGFRFWRRFMAIENVVAIKIAPFDRYGTLDVIRAAADAGRLQEIALYTGNDDNILADLLTPFVLDRKEERAPARIVGGLLGQWAVWTFRAVQMLKQARQAWHDLPTSWSELLKLNAQLTDANAAIFDAANRYRGCIPGIHEVLRRQGLLEGIWCLDPDEELSPGQSEEIDRVIRNYPHLTDDDFVSRHRENWLRA